MSTSAVSSSLSMYLKGKEVPCAFTVSGLRVSV
jgi:hypothetical protein